MFLQAGQPQAAVDHRDADPVVADQRAGVFHEFVRHVRAAVADPFRGEFAILLRDFRQRRLVVADVVVVPVGPQDGRHEAVFAASAARTAAFLPDVVGFFQIDGRGVDHVVPLVGAGHVAAGGSLHGELLLVEGVDQHLGDGDLARRQHRMPERVADDELLGNLQPFDLQPFADDDDRTSVAEDSLIVDLDRAIDR